MNNVPPDLSYFLLALEQVVRPGNGGSWATLALVESAWHSSGAHSSMFGWVVVLVSGRRLYIEMEVAEVEGQRPIDLEITPLLAAQQRYPDELEDAVAWYEPDHINWHLGLPGPTIH